MKQDMEQKTRQMLLNEAEFKGSRVLEIGCGNGRVMEMYANDTAFTAGLEPDQEAICSTSCATANTGFICASGMELPFKDKCFDITLFTLSLHHHPAPLEAIAEAARITAPKGRILVLEPTKESEIQRLCKIFHDEDKELDNVEEALRKTGMQILSRNEFNTRFIFKNYEDVSDYCFSYYNHPPDKDKNSRIRRFLGKRAELSPIYMEDTLRLTCIGKQ